MFCQAGFEQWLTTIMQHLSSLSKPQAHRVGPVELSGMVLARSCALNCSQQSTGGGHAALGADRAPMVARMVLRHYAQTGPQAPSAACGDVFCPFVGLGGQLVAGDATGAGPRGHDLGRAWWCWQSAVVYRGGAIPVAWVILARGRQACVAAGVAAACCAG